MLKRTHVVADRKDLSIPRNGTMVNSLAFSTADVNSWDHKIARSRYWALVLGFLLDVVWVNRPCQSGR